MTKQGVNALQEHLERVWVLACNRCANEDLSYEKDPAAAVNELFIAGWRFDNHRVFCPGCSDETT